MASFRHVELHQRSVFFLDPCSYNNNFMNEGSLDLQNICSIKNLVFSGMNYKIDPQVDEDAVLWLSETAISGLFSDLI